MDIFYWEELYIESFSTYGKRLKPVDFQKRIKKLHSLQSRIRSAQKPQQITECYSILLKMYADLKIVSKSSARDFKRELGKAVRLLAQKDWEFLMQKTGDEALVEEYMEYLQWGDNLQIITKGTSIWEKYDKFQSKNLAKQIQQLVQTDPTAEFPKTREMKRHFHLHVGPTNSGKTYQAIQSLKKAQAGAYLSPLRLLALEVFDTLNDAGIPTSLKTGEEHIDVENSLVVSQTVETLDIDGKYDIVVIDECQMIADPERGHAWSTAIHGVMAEEIYLLASDNVTPLLKAIIEACGDTFDVTTHERKTALVVEKDFFSLAEEADLKKEVREGDCFILFSKRKVLDMAARLEMAGIRASVIYGKLPPETRKAEVARFVAGETKVVVSTDAIGMGVNLPIQRIIFAESSKFDGNDVRNLEASEILQIAGRAGRFGKYDTGYVTGTNPKFQRILRNTIGEKLPLVDRAVLGFPKVLTGMDAELNEILDAWYNMPAKSPYVKMNVERMQILYSVLKKESDRFVRVYGSEDKAVIYDMISCPIDERDDEVVALWVHYCLTYAADTELEKPKKPYGVNELESLETYYKLLELYHMFSIHMGKYMDEEWLSQEKSITETAIEQYLISRKMSFVRKCKICHKTLPMNARFGVCDQCFGGYRRPAYRR